MSTVYLRDPKTSIILHLGEVIALRPDGKTICLRNAVDDVQRALVLLRHAKTAEEIATEMTLTLPRAEKLLNQLVTHKILLSGSPEEIRNAIPSRFPPSRQFSCKNVIMGICGTIQAASVLGLAVLLKTSFAEEVHVILTDAARKFVTRDVFAYFGLSVWTDQFEVRGEVNVPHIWLAARADIVVIIPASAHTIHRLAAGTCSDLLSLVTAATKAPVVVVPTMNPTMFDHPPIRRNMERLRADGFYIVEPGLGYEISSSTDGTLGFCGIGMGETTILPMLRAILSNQATGGAPPIPQEATKSSL